MRTWIFVAVATALVSPAGSAMAQAGDATTAPSEENQSDANRIICKREKIIGSRLGSKKICATAAQWEQMRADNRQAVERAQANRPKSGL